MLHKTALATAASVGIVIIAGATAVGANIGILRSNDDQFGELSAVATSVPASTVPAGAPEALTGPDPSTATAPGPEVTALEVEGIATVTVARDGQTLTVVAVEPQPGWTWSLDDPDGEAHVEVELRSATEEVDLYLTVVDGQVQTRVERAALPTASSAPSSGGSAGHDDEDHDEEHDDDHDDEHEYEGAEDDD